MTTKPSCPINLFDVQSSQKVIGQDKFLKAFEKILNHGGYCQGPETKELDAKLAEYAGVNYCVTCSSGTDALILPLMAWDVKKGDAVFVSSFTFVASAEAPAILGATPIFVDSDPDTWTMDVNDLERAVENVKKEGKLNLKAIIAVDIFGNPCDYDAIKKIADKYGMKLLSDSAQSYGSSYAAFTNSEKERDLMVSARVHGMSPEDHYDNVRMGLNARMDSFQAAVLLLKLPLLDNELIAREEIAQRYNNELDSYFKTQKVLDGCKSARALYSVTCDDRDELMAYLRENGIPCGAYYPRPVNTQTAYAKWNTRSLPVCEKLSKTILSIPMHPYLTKEAQDYVISMMNAFAAKKKSKAA